MPHTPVPAAELSARIDRLRNAMTQRYPTGPCCCSTTRSTFIISPAPCRRVRLVVTPEQAVLFVRRSFDCAVQESLFPEIQPMGSFRTIREAFSDIPETVYVATRTMTLQKLAMLRKHLPFTPQAADDVLSALRAVKSEYELACMRRAGKLHQTVIEEVAPALLRHGVSEARLCSEICTFMLDRGAMGISRYNQPAARGCARHRELQREQPARFRA